MRPCNQPTSPANVYLPDPVRRRLGFTPIPTGTCSILTNPPSHYSLCTDWQQQCQCSPPVTSELCHHSRDGLLAGPISLTMILGIHANSMTSTIVTTESPMGALIFVLRKARWCHAKPSTRTYVHIISFERRNECWAICNHGKQTTLRGITKL